MYFSSDAKGTPQIWRQRFPDGAPEQITFGPTVAEGAAMSPDGRSLITSLGLDQFAVWLSENGKERQISSEGSARLPAWGDGIPRSVFSPDGNKLYYLVRNGMQRGFSGGELWVSDLQNGFREAVLPGLVITTYDISRDGKRLVFASAGDNGKSRIWLTPVDRHSPPQLLPPPEALGPIFGGDNEIYFRGPQDGQWSIYELRLDSGQIRKAIPDPAVNPPIISPDGEWIVSKTPGGGPDNSSVVKAYPKNGGAPIVVCKTCVLRWPRDGRSLFISIGPKTVVVPLEPGKAFPALPAEGLNSETDVQKARGVRVIDLGDSFPGLTATTYAFQKRFVQRNLYRIWLP
jgi:eukaryotic-like serine/threonine-protein kinase